jgi:predicted RNase H-like HicB family nuclease
MKRYVGILCKDDDRAFGIHFPDLPGCVAGGETEDEALADAAIALRSWAEDVSELPVGSSVEALRQNPDAVQDLSEGGCAVIIPLISVGRKQRLNIMLEPVIVSAADQAAKAAGVSRSAYIENAVVGWLAQDTGAARVVLQKAKING